MNCFLDNLTDSQVHRLHPQVIVAITSEVIEITPMTGIVVVKPGAADV